MPAPLPAPKSRHRRKPQNPLTVAVPKGSRARKRPPNPQDHQPPTGSRGRKRPPASGGYEGGTRPTIDGCAMALPLLPVLALWALLRAAWSWAAR